VAESLQPGHQHRGREARLPEVDKGACEEGSPHDSPNLQELLLLMPSLETRVGRMNLKLLEELLQDTAGIASKLVRMKLLFPTADIYKIVQSRPSILSDAEFSVMETTAPKLHSLFPEEDIGWMVTCQSVLLVEDIDYILQELARLLAVPRLLVPSVFARDPNLVNAVSCNRRLWGAEQF